MDTNTRPVHKNAYTMCFVANRVA